MSIGNFNHPSNFPFGFESGLQVRGVPILNSYPAGAIWVNSATGANGNPGTFKKPLSTLAYALSVAAADDTILIAPGHTETVTGVAGLSFATAGVSVVGLGSRFRRPQFLMDGASTVTAAVTAAGVTVQNLQFRAGDADVVTCFDLDAKGFSLLGCEFVDNTSGENFLSIITSGSTTDNVCDHLQAIGNRWLSPDAAALHFIAQTGHLDHMDVVGNVVVLPGGTASELIDVTAGDLFRGAFIAWNFLQHAMTTGELFISNNGSTNSGVIAHNRCRHADVTTTHDLGIDGLGCALFDNLSTSVDNLSGLLLPAADVNS